jgi:hypothetical protein
MRLSCASLAAGALVGCGLQVQAQLVNGIKAVVHDAIVTYEDVEVLTEPAREFFARKYRSEPDVFVKEVDKVKKDNLDTLMNRQLILHEFATAGYNLPESVVDEMVQDEIRANYNDRRTLTKTLQAQGRTYEKFRQAERDKLIVRLLRAKNVSQEIIVSPHKVETYYLAHRDQFKIDEEVKIRLLTLPQSTDPAAPSAMKMAENILTELKGGTSFAEMVATYSQAKQEGIWYEWSALTKHLADIAASLQAGQHSGVLSRSSGEDYWVCQYEAGQPVLGRHYVIEGSKENRVEEQRFDSAATTTNLPPPREFFLLLVEDKRPAHFKPINEVRVKIEDEFLLEERARLEKQWIERLKKKTFVRVFPGG